MTQASLDDYFTYSVDFSNYLKKSRFVNSHNRSQNANTTLTGSVIKTGLLIKKTKIVQKRDF